MSRKGKLSDTQKLAIRAAYDKFKLAGDSAQVAMEAVAAEMGVHWQTIRKVLKGTNTLDPKLVQDVKKQQANELNKIINDLIKDFEGSKAKLKGLTPGQFSFTVGTLIDKVRQLLGEDVTKIEVKEVGERVNNRLEELKAMREALKKSMIIPGKPEDN